MRCSFVIPGAPYGKARHRTTRTGIAYTPKETINYENLVKTIFIQQRGDWAITSLPIMMTVTAVFPIPKSASRGSRLSMTEGTVRPTKRPDWDNIGKVISDSLNEIAYKDDSQVVDARVKKFYGGIPQVNVIMETIE